jgi:hypothetical protein
MEKILDFDEYSWCVGRGLVVVMRLVPCNLPTQREVRELCDDRTIVVPLSSGSIWFDVFDTPSRDSIAQAVFAADDDLVRCDSIYVAEGHEERGIADRLHRLASRVFDAPVVPDEYLTEEEQRFWGDRTSIMYNAEACSV